MKRIFKILMVLTIFITACNKGDENSNLIKYEKLEYESVEDLFDLAYPINENGTRIEDYFNMCSVLYTIEQDDLKDEVHEKAFESSVGDYNDRRWWALYNIIEEKSYTMYDGECELAGVDPYATANPYAQSGYDDFGRVEVLVLADKKFYVTSTTYEIVDAIRHFEVVSNGEGTEGYQESLDFLYDTAINNGNDSIYIGDINEIVTKHKDELDKLATMSDQEVVEEISSNYDDYKKMLERIEADMDIID